MIKSLKILLRQGKQYIPDISAVKLPPPFRGRPVVSSAKVDERAVAELCPTGAIGTGPVRVDIGKCAFCGECALSFPEKIKFTQDFRLASNNRDRLIIREGAAEGIALDDGLIREEIRKTFGGSLKLRQVSAGGDNSAEMELNATSNVNFDMGRFGIEFVASPRHADGIVITGPISQNMAEPLRTCYEAVSSPKLIILYGVDAISGGIFAGSGALDRSFLADYKIDLYVPGNPPHPLTFISGVLDLVRNK